MNHRTGVGLALVGVVMGLLALPASGQLAASRLIGNAGRDAPWEMIISEADLIAVATVTTAPPAPTTNADDPTGAASRQQAQEFKVKVEKVLGGAATKDMAGKEIGVLANAVPFTLSVNLTPGERYLVFLTRPGVEKEVWTALPLTRAVTAADESVIKMVAERCDMEKWNWGKETDGLRMLALPQSAMSAANATAVVLVATAIQNVSKDPIYLNTFAQDRILSLKATWDGTPVGARAATSMIRTTVDFDPATSATMIKPGGVVWLGQWGRQIPNAAYVIDVPSGACEIRVVYKSTRVAETGSGGKVWKGSMESAPTKVEVTKPEER